MPWIKMNAFKRVASVQVKAELEVQKPCAQAESCLALASASRGPPQIKMNSDINGNFAI